jgi:tRNA G37 N-methylase Trm5
MSSCQPARQKNKRVRTVVNKLDSIDTQFRFFKMELLAGEPNYVVEHVGSPPLRRLLATVAESK